jgi:DNA processing protein
METKARFLLNAVDIFTPEQQKKWVDLWGKAENFIEQQDWFDELSPEHQTQWLRRRELLERQKSYETLLSQGVRFVLKEDPDYPPSLAYVDCPPHLLYVKGTLPAHSLCGISVIGTRSPTLYGRQMAQLFGSGLANEGFVILSGCARGIDALAMKAAMDVQGQAVGVLGTGIDVVYPSENAQLFAQIEKQGALVSEFAPGAKPLKHHFPWRNRLISGWSLGLLVVEALIRSGTAGTVSWALQQGKDVFAIPGPANSEFSKGPHKMIREGAYLVEHPNEISEFFKDVLDSLRREHDTGSESGCLDPEENELGLIREPRPMDDLMEITGLNVVELMRQLNRAVLEGKAKKYPGGSYGLA